MTMTPRFQKIPSELRDRPQWVCWRMELNEKGKETKVPYCPTATGRKASSTDPATWTTFAEAVSAYERGDRDKNGNPVRGIGYVFAKDDPFFGIDVDHVRDPKTGTFEQWARDLLKRLNTYSELSQSATGAHAIGRGKVPGGTGRKKVMGPNEQAVEMYSGGRYFCFTGLQLAGTPATVEDRQAVLNAVHTELFGAGDAVPSGEKANTPPATTAAPAPLSLTDRELIEKATAAKNGAAFSALWRGDWQGAGYASQSDADAAFLGMLRFWTGGDKARAFALFSQSGLNREKWAEREDYRERTWAKVADGDTYTPPVAVSLGGGAKAEPSGPPDTWATPEPFSSADVPLAPWPWEVFPPVLADLGREIVRTIGTCDELPGLGLLCVASIALRNKIKVQIKAGHTQHANLYGLAVLPPGQKKTPVGKVLLPPFTDWQREQMDAYRDALNQWEARARIARARVAKMEKAAGDANDEEAQELQRAIEEQQKVLKAKPVKPCLFTNDATSERVARLMDEHAGAMGVFTSEGRKVLAIARGRYTKGSGSDVDLWLAAYSGDYIRVDRNKEGFEPIELPEPVLSAFVAAQPDTLRALGENEEIRASGFLARWDYICPDAITAAEYRTASIAPHIQHAYGEAIRRLIELPYAVFPDGTPAPHLIGFTLDAFQRWTAYHNELAAEAGRSVGHKPTAFVEWMGKLPERVARVAGIFRAVRHVAEGVPLGAIDAPEIDDAYAVTLALLTHGKRAFGMMGQDADQAKARVLWRALDGRRVKLRDEREREGLGRIEAVKPKDVARNGWAGIEKTDEARRVLEVLSTKGWLSDAVTLPGKARGQQHDLYYMRPDSPAEGGKP
jgi:hypothetical protein